MDNKVGIDFLKNRIKERLASVADQMGHQRYKLYLAMVEDCNNFNDLREMAELDLQMELFDYVKDEVQPKLDAMGMSVSDLRKLDSGAYPKLASPTEKFEIDPADLDELLNDSDASDAMALLLMNRLNNEPEEEKYRQQILDFQLEEKIDESTVDNMSDDDLGDLGGLLEEEVEDDEDEEFSGMSDLEGFFGNDESEDSEDDSEEFEDESLLESELSEEFPESEAEDPDISEEDNMDLSSDDINLADLGDYASETEDVPDEIVDTGIMSEDEIFSDVDESELDFGDTSEDTEDNIDYGIMSEDEIFGDIDDSELNVDDSEDESASDESLDSQIDQLGFDFDDSDTPDDSEALEDEDSDIDGIEPDLDEIEADPDDPDFGAMSEDEIFGDSEDDSVDNIDALNDAEIDNMFGDLDSEDESDDPMKDIDNIDDSELGLDLVDTDTDKENDDPFAEIDSISEDSIGLVDDLDSFMETDHIVPSIKSKPSNVKIHSQDKPVRSNGVKPTTVFRDGTTRGDKTQDMFNMFNNIGIGSAKAAKKLKDTTIKIAKSDKFQGFLKEGINDFEVNL